MPWPRCAPAYWPGCACAGPVPAVRPRAGGLPDPVGGLAGRVDTGRQAAGAVPRIQSQPPGCADGGGLMAGGMEWLRWHHGSVTDPKFALVARRAGCNTGEVLAVWAFLLENGKHIKDDSATRADTILGFRPGTSAKVISHLRERGLVSGDSIANPRRYFPARAMRPSGGAWQAIREFVFRRDGYTCQYCGSTDSDLECDHITPVADGGGHDAENLTTACRPCNRRKGSMSIEAWRRSSGR